MAVGQFTAIGAGLAIGLAAIGTGIAQAKIGAAGTGALAEDEDLFGKALIMVAIPETLIIFGLVIAMMVLGRV